MRVPGLCGGCTRGWAPLPCAAFAGCRLRAAALPPLAESTTVFAGQCFVDADGQETLETTWLLRQEAAAHADDWKATL